MVHVSVVEFARDLVWVDRHGPFEKRYADYSMQINEADSRLPAHEGLRYIYYWRDHSDWFDQPKEAMIRYNTQRNRFSLLVSQYLRCPQRGVKVFSKEPQLYYY